MGGGEGVEEEGEDNGSKGEKPNKIRDQLVSLKICVSFSSVSSLLPVK